MPYDFDLTEAFAKILEKVLDNANNDVGEEQIMSDVVDILSEDVLPVLFANEVMKAINLAIEESNRSIIESESAYKFQLKYADVYRALIYLLSKNYEKYEDMEKNFVDSDPA